MEATILIRFPGRPTLGAHPAKSEWFHCTSIHTMVDERLANQTLRRNRACLFIIIAQPETSEALLAKGNYEKPAIRRISISATDCLCN